MVKVRERDEVCRQLVEHLCPVLVVPDARLAQRLDLDRVTAHSREVDLETRIDAEYYQSAFVEADGRLREGVATETLQKLWATYNRIYIGIAGFEAVSETSHYTPYLRPADIGLSGEIDYVNLPWCKRHWLEDHGKKGCARPGDLLIEVKGNTRKVAVVNERIPDRCIVSGSAYRLVLRSGVDPHFVMAYFLSPTGQLLKRRLTSNTTISYIDPESFRSLRVPLPPQEVQRAIGNKVRKAERLRELSRLAYAAVDAKIHELYGRLPKGESSELSVWVRPIQLGESRLDAWFHRPLYLRMAHDLQLRKDVVLVAQLANRVTETFRPEEWNSDTFEYFEIGGVDSATSVATPTVVPVVEASSRAAVRTQRSRTMFRSEPACRTPVSKSWSNSERKSC